MADWNAFEIFVADNEPCPKCGGALDLYPPNFPGVDAYCVNSRCKAQVQIKRNTKNTHTGHASSLTAMLAAIMTFGAENIFFVIGTVKRYGVHRVEDARRIVGTRTYRPSSSDVSRRSGVKKRDGKPVGYKTWTEVAKAHNLMVTQDFIKFSWA